MLRFISRAIVLATIGAMLGAAGPAAAADAPQGVSPSRQAFLTQGINLSHWFSQSGDYSRKHLESYDTAKDAALIKAMGFRHVRFAFNDATVVDKDKPAVLNPEKMKLFDAALDMLLAQGLAVIVDLHPESDFKRAVAKDDAAVENLVGMWKELAAHLASRDPERVFFEVMNESEVKDAARWNLIQGKVLAAMRASAPRHTLIATGPNWSGLGDLEKIETVADKNVIYNFHCYDPFWFTHQQATWAGDVAKNLKDVPYPSSPELVEKILPQIANEASRNQLKWYGKEQWNAEKIDGLIARAAAWGAKHGVVLTCNEFGVYRKAPAADRCRCIADVRTALEKYKIGWCMWDYAGGFSVATGQPGSRAADPETVKALGLAPAK